MPATIRLSILLLSILSFAMSCGGESGRHTPTYIGKLDSVADGEDGQDAAGPGADITAPDAAVADTPPSTCTEGETTCISGKLATCDGTFGWLLEPCPIGSVCEDGACVSTLCEPYEKRCHEDGGVQICGPDGQGFSEPFPCPPEQICQEGVCVPLTCEPGEVLCDQNQVLTCNEDGTGWTISPCQEDEVCFDGACIQCVKEADCEEGLVCVDGFCQPQPLEMLTLSLPDGKVGEEYLAELKAVGGEPPLAWSLVGGELPEGLAVLDGGSLSGTPTEAGTFTCDIQVTDGAEQGDERSFTFEIHQASSEVLITSGSPLPSAEEGSPYQFGFEASGGFPPHSWGVVDGALPAGLSMDSGGTLAGVPTEHGDFGFTVKVFDNGDPVSFGSKDFQMTVEIAPLVIVGDTSYDLWVTQVIILPLITVVESIPIPYSVDLMATGGVKPYHWEEIEIPGYVSFLIPNGGVPEGLSLDEDGILHGSVTDPDQVVEVSIPFTGINLTGFFFMARVSDSQDPADSDQALYLIPTVPVSF